MRKGIILAGGSATRLNPTTKYITKHLLPVYDKPMINYSLSILMLAKIKNILIICNKRDLNSFQDYLGDGRRLGIKISYAIQKKPNGLAESFIIGEKFLKRDPVALILGDNIFFGSGLQKILVSANKSSKGVVFLKRVTDPERFGVAYFDKKNKNLQKIVEKPKKPKSNFAVTGLYFYENDIVELAKKLKPSARGELEISELNNLYIKKRKLSFVELSRSTIWKDAGTFDSLIDSGNIIKNFQEQNLTQIGFLEEISIRNKWIDKSKILQNIKEKYLRDYLKKI
jgi:glucose-1-phosphate thymidylyltransferase